MPHHHAKNLATFTTTTIPQVDEAIKSALLAKPEWEAMPFNDRAAIFLKVSLIDGPSGLLFSSDILQATSDRPLISRARLLV